MGKSESVRGRRFLSFSLRTLLLCLFLAAIPLTWWHNGIQQRRAVRKIQDTGGSVVYRYENSPLPPLESAFNPLERTQSGWIQKRRNRKLRAAATFTPEGPTWINDRFGIDHLNPVLHASVWHPVDTVSALRGLMTLELVGQEIDDEYLSRIHFSKLRRLTLRGTANTSRGVAGLKDLRHFEVLDFGGTKIDETTFSDWPRMPALRELSLAYTAVDGDKLEFLNKFPNLETLDLEGIGVTDDGLKRMETLTKLRVLSLPYSSITSDGLPAISHLDELRYLDLSHASVAGSETRHLSKLRRLEHLLLGNTQVDTSSVQHLSGLDKLKTLDLSSTQIDGEALPILGTLKNLEFLNLAATMIPSDSLQHLKGLMKLEELWVMIDRDNPPSKETEDILASLPNLGYDTRRHLGFGRVRRDALQKDRAGR